MFITNVGTAERTVEFRSLPVIGEEPPEVDPGRPSWVYGDIRSTDDGYSVGFGVDFDPGLTMKIAPGEKIEAADKILGPVGNDGTSVKPRDCDVRAYVGNLYIDGQRLTVNADGRGVPTAIIRRRVAVWPQ
jgi:hypothetical protein